METHENLQPNESNLGVPGSDTVTNNEKLLQPDLGSIPPKKSKKPLLIGAAAFLLVLILLCVLVGKEYLRANKYAGDLKQLQSHSYFKDMHNYLESNGGQFVDYRSCNVASTNELWNFEQADSDAYYSDTFSIMYNTLEGRIRGSQSEVKKNMPPEYTKNFFSRFIPSVNNSVEKRQNIVKLTDSADVLFNSNEYIDYCTRVIYQGVIDKLSYVEIYANGATTVTNSPDVTSNKPRVEAIIKTLETTKVPPAVQEVNRGFIATLKAMSQTFSEIATQRNTSESVRDNKAAFARHRQSLDDNLKELSKATKDKIKSQPNEISAILKAAEQ